MLPKLAPELNLLYRGGMVKRYHVVPNIHTETVGHHSHMVACLVTFLYPDCSRDLIKAALYHDLAEVETGDIPSPSKRATGTREAFNSYEQEVFENHGIVSPALSSEEAHALMVCDVLAGLIKCHQEFNLGNRLIMYTFANYASYFLELKCVNKNAIDLYNSLVIIQPDGSQGGVQAQQIKQEKTTNGYNRGF